MNEMKKGSLKDARVARMRGNPDNSALRFEVVCESAIGPMRIPYETRSQAEKVAAWINVTGLFPDNKLAFIG
jgi:hypothetical protein